MRTMVRLQHTHCNPRIFQAPGWSPSATRTDGLPAVAGGDVPLAAQDDAVLLVVPRGAAGDLVDRVDARSSRGQTRRSVDLADELPEVVSDPAEHDVTGVLRRGHA